MKVSLSKFYKEVTGKTTANRGSTTNALNRWHIPYEVALAKGDCVDVAHLPAAREAWAKECAEAATERAARTGVPATLDSRLEEIGARIDAIAAAVGRMEERLNRAMSTDV